jgi:hypothetical protein
MQKFELAHKVQRIIDNQLVVNLQIIDTVIKMADGLDDEADRVLMKGICLSIGKALEANKCVLPKD